MIGVGLMGTVMSRRLIAAGLAVAGYDPRREARDGIVAIGGSAAGSVADIARRCRRAVISVFDTGQVEDVIEGQHGILAVRAGERRLELVVNTSTCEPDRVAAG